MKHHLSQIKTVPLYAVLSLVVLLVYSSSTSPLWDNCEGDASVFSLIGWNWACGLPPYVTAWDSKGPLIFFVNMLGHLFGRGEGGTFVIQLLNMTAVLWLTERLLRRHCRPITAVGFTLLMLAGWITISSRGNMVCDYSMLLAVPSVLLAYEYTLGMDGGRRSPSPLLCAVCGAFLAASVLSRMTNFMLMAVVMMEIACLMAWRRMWRGIALCALWVAVGFLVVFTPFAVWFAANGLFGEMWYAAVEYNVEYALTSHSGILTETTTSPLYGVQYFFCLIAPLLWAAVAFVRKERRTVATVWAIASGVTLLWIVKSYAFENYAISYLPVMLIPLVELSRMGRQRLARLTLYAVCAVVVAGCANYTRIYFIQHPESLANFEPELRMMREIPERDSFVAYNCEAAVYMKAARHPCYPYFCVQDWAILNGESLRSRVRERFSRGNAQWIMVHDYRTCGIRDILEARYDIVQEDTAHGLTLFRLKGYR